MFKQYKLKNYHFQLVFYVVALTIIGIMVIGSAKPSVQNKQILGFAMGLVAMVVISLMDYSFILKFSWLYYIGIIGLLLMVRFFGVTRGGAKRWIVIAGIQFQPSEMAKIVLILFLAYFFMKYQEKVNTIKILALSAGLVIIPLYLIKQQPDLSTTIVTGLIYVVLLFISGLSYKIIVPILAVSIPVGITGLLYIVNNMKGTTNYQLRRILAWWYPEDPMFSDLSLQQQNSIMAIGSGQLWGKGLNNAESTSMKNGHFILEPQTDFIFTVTGEELGFVGTVAVIVLLLLIVIECILIGKKAKDFSGKLICCGMAGLIGFQSFVNICVTTGLLPNTGIPLPFVSYGLTSVLSLFAGIGFVLNVGLQPRKY